MLKHAGVSTRELFADLLIDVRVPTASIERVAAVEVVRRRRDD